MQSGKFMQLILFNKGNSYWLMIEVFYNYDGFSCYSTCIMLFDVYHVVRRVHVFSCYASSVCVENRL